LFILEVEPGAARPRLHRRRSVVVLEYRRGDSVEELKKKIAAVKLGDVVPGLLDGLVEKGDRVVCVCPIDESAPKGRLILPQVQLIRDCLDRHIAASVCQPEELAGELSHSGGGNVLVVTDSQAFGKVKEILAALARGSMRLTSFSILFARQKGDLDEFTAGLKAIGNLKDGDTVLVAEGCTHHRQCGDIGTVKIPKWLNDFTGKKLVYETASGTGYPDDLTPYALVVHCGGCMLNEREVKHRASKTTAQGVPITNYGTMIAYVHGILKRSLSIFPELAETL
jgi:[FeFe] hydrogenase H-cluster maturation GTPase HydF